MSEAAAKEEEDRYYALIAQKARLLYAALPAAGFSQASFEELGRAAQQNRSYDALTPTLKATLIRLTAKYDTEVKALEVEHAVVETVSEGKASTPEPQEEPDDEEDTEDEGTAPETPADDLPPEAKPPVQPNPPAEPAPIEMPEPSGQPATPPKADTAPASL